MGIQNLIIKDPYRPLIELQQVKSLFRKMLRYEIHP